jgi:RpiB/LacA/LacB family sugar-phosphate isomerase
VKLVISSDHAGFSLKEEVRAYLTKAGHEMVDLGAFTCDPQDDYPDFAERVGEAIKSGEAPRGILICGSGVGVSVAANKIPGIRAGMCHDTYSAHQGVEHDDMNVLVLGYFAGLRTCRCIPESEIHFQRRAVYAAIQESAGDRGQVSTRRLMVPVKAQFFRG